jgi:hypothetical protein
VKMEVKRHKFKDLNARIEKMVPKEKELEIIDVLLDEGNPLNLSLISRINIAAAWAHMRQVGVRGGEDRSLFIHQAFLGTMEHLGEGKENNVDNFFHTTGKTNQNGRPD